MKYALYALILVATLLSGSVSFAGKPDVGAVYVGQNPVDNTECTLTITKIKKNIMVDDITTSLVIQGRAPVIDKVGEYNITNNEYMGFNGQVRVNVRTKVLLMDNYFYLKISKDKSTAKINRQFIRGGQFIFQESECQNLHLQQEPEVVPEVKAEELTPVLESVETSTDDLNE